MDILRKALEIKRGQLSEHESKAFLEGYGFPVTRELVVKTEEEALRAAKELGFPLVLKIDSPYVAHKTEKGLVMVGIGSPEALSKAFSGLIQRHPLADGEGVLVQEMVEGKRELAVGLTKDPQFGPCIMFGLGGIFLEILNDVTFRVAPITTYDAMEMMEEIRSSKILQEVRGMPPADRDALARLLVTLGDIGMRHPEIREIDMNPVILRGKDPVVVDALVILENG